MPDTDTVVVTIVSRPVIVTSMTPVTTTGGNDGTATAVVTGGTPPFTYGWTGGGNTPSISNLTAGTYVITVIDSNGCTVQNVAVVTTQVGVNPDANDIVGLKVFPNPADDYLKISWNEPQTGKLNLTLLDVSGKLIREFHPSINAQATSILLESADILPGFYFLRAELNGKVSVESVGILR